MNLVHSLLKQLVQYPSITPNDAGCQDFMMDYLKKLGFDCQRLDNPPVSNFFACHGNQSPLLVFAGHTDVVPAGDHAKWQTDPFTLTYHNDRLYGRGTADMKGSLACMMVSASNFIQNHPDFSGSIGFLITSGEEGDQFDLGTPYVMEQLKQQGITPNYCIVGEPSSTERAGDVIKIGRRGSLSAQITLHGKQGHVAYPHLADNPIHRIAPVLTELSSKIWDQGNLHFPPTSLQITHIQSGGQAGNIIPGELTVHMNFRYSSELTADTLRESVEQCFRQHGLTANMKWRLNGEPFLTEKGQLLDSTQLAIQKHTGQPPKLSTSGGTSDGRFIAPYGVEVIELGPVNASIHQVNEWVTKTDLDTLTAIYYSVCEELLLATR